MSFTTLDSVEDFFNFVKTPNLAAVHFTAPWVSQCDQVTTVLKQFAKLPEFQGNKFGICDAENLSEISLQYKVDSVPTVILYKNGEEVDRVDGVDIAKLTAKVRDHNGSQSDVNTSLQLDEKLKALINRNSIMVFMKGTRDAPRCGFSKTLVHILNRTGFNYDTFDILSDEEVRQGLKTYSDWPTYPQLYVNGELIGGLDIVKELEYNGDLLTTLNG